jgi:hypothetical protein
MFETVHSCAERQRRMPKWTQGLEKPLSKVTVLYMGVRLDIQRREDMKLDVSGSYSLIGASEEEVLALLTRLGYDEKKYVSWP